MPDLDGGAEMQSRGFSRRGKLARLLALIAGVLVFSSTVLAAGTKVSFYCISVDDDVVLKGHYERQADGSLVPQEMRVIDPAAGAKRAEKAYFFAADGHLKGAGDTIVALFDPSYRGSSRVTSRFANIQVGEVERLTLRIDLSYYEPLNDQQVFSAEVVYQLRDLTNLYQDFDCAVNGVVAR